MVVVVDNRAFVIGLSELFRERMKAYEAEVLLPQAERACRTLGLESASVPVEGYYSESTELTRFFRLVRALQLAPRAAADSGPSAASVRELRRALGSAAMGRAVGSDRLLAPMSSPFGEALRSSGDWSVETLSREARRLVRSDDAGLVAVASATGDPVAICVTRETVALTADVEMADAELPQYGWAVTAEVAEVAERFVRALSEATGIALPPPRASSSEEYGRAADRASIDGRCVRVGERPETSHPFYHWHIEESGGEPVVSDFWSTSVWTTDALRRTPSSRRPAPGSRVGAPPR